jgi:hypothetical protein
MDGGSTPHIDRNTAATRWRGERMDRHLGVWVLCSQANRAAWLARGENRHDVSAETSERAARCSRNVSAEASERAAQFSRNVSAETSDA